MPEPLWTAAEIAAATGGDVDGAFGPFDCFGVSIDTRTIEPGDLFVALAGERDGHAFAAQALAKGAAGVLASRPVDGPSVRVADTLRALEQLGVAARERAPEARRCAVTGSVGKTSVTQAIAAALTLAGPSHSSVKSYNNHIGVPLTLARMPRETGRVVFEIGMNHADEIRPLTRMVRPHAAVVTTVGPVHVENFPDGEIGVARAKAEIFEGLLPGGVAILNADHRWFDLLAESARAHGARVLSFGTGEGCEARLLSFEVGDGPSTAFGGPPPHLRWGGSRAAASLSSPCNGEGDREAVEGPSGAVITATLHGRALRFPIAQSGAHWGLNSLATLLAVEALGAPIEAALEALAAFAPLGGRGAEHRLALQGGEAILIDESYNANPMSMAAALRTLGARPAARRIAVLTDMLELAEPEAVHAALAEPIAAAGVDLAFLAGPMMHALWGVLPPARRGAWRETAAEIVPEVLTVIKPGDVVMVKGSNGSRASLVAQALLAAGASAHRKAEEGR
jgi:UDP-N-acetylmuramoyl-tripeptide--D-alanyl-D-alanine ligase